MRWLRFLAICLAALAALSGRCAAAVEPTRVTASDVRKPQRSITDFVAEAAARFGIPARWIEAIIRVESAGDPHATSQAGATGLMQLMPRTYADMRVALHLGTDPYDPRDNILAGAAYLRAMYDRFGPAGFLAAYNAGPARWQAYRADAWPLPPETIGYTIKLDRMLGTNVAGVPFAAAPTSIARPEEAPIFARLSGTTIAVEPQTAGAYTDDLRAPYRHLGGGPDTAAVANNRASSMPGDGLFVARTANRFER